MAATTVDTLLVRIEADLSSLKRQLNQSQQATQRATSKMRQNFGRIEGAIAGVGKRLGTLRGGILAVTAVMATGLGLSVARTAAEFQDLEMTLATVFGGMEEGQAAMSFIQTFAQRTPFDIQTLSRAFIQLGGAGIKPTEELLTTFGDAAAATTNRVAAFEAMVRIATRAVGGGLGLEELEQLVNQGIPVYKILQQEIGVSRQEISELGQTAEGAAKIMNALQTGLQKEFGGGMARASRNLSVSMSNLGIAMTNLKLALGEGVAGVGLTGAFTFLSDTLTQVAVILKPIVHLLGAALTGAIYAVTAPLRLITETILYLGEVLVDFGRYLGTFDGFEAIGEAAESLNGSLASLQAQMNKNIEGLEATEKSSEDADKAIKDLIFSNSQLEAEFDGLSEAGLKINEIMHKYDDINQKQFKTPAALIRKEIELTEKLRIKQQAEEDAKNKTEALDATVKKLTQDNEMLQLSVLGVSEAEIAYQQVLAQFDGDLGEHSQKIRRLTEEHLALQEKLAAQEAEQDKYNERIEEGTSIAEGFASQQEKIQEQINLVTDAFYAGAIGEESYRQSLEALEHQMAQLDPMFKAIEQASERAADSISDALADAVIDGKLSLDTFQDIFRDFVKSIIKEAIKTYVIKKIFGSFMGGGFGFGFAGGGSVSAPTPTPMGLAGGGKIPARASGGAVLVGERGPELFIPHSAGVIKNNHDTNNMLGGGRPVVVNQNINVSTGVAQTVRAEVMTMMPRIKAETIQAVVDGKRRGGSISKVFA